MGAPHWTVDEEVAWRAWFAQGGVRPRGRTVDAARRRLRPRVIASLGRAEMHAMATAIMPFLQEVPYRGEGTHIKFVERVQLQAVEPWREEVRPDDEVASRAVAQARKVLAAMSANDRITASRTSA